MRKELKEEKCGLDELPLGLREVDEGKDKEDGIGGGKDSTVMASLRFLSAFFF